MRQPAVTWDKKLDDSGFGAADGTVDGFDNIS